MKSEQRMSAPKFFVACDGRKQLIYHSLINAPYRWWTEDIQKASIYTLSEALNLLHKLHYNNPRILDAITKSPVKRASFTIRSVKDDEPILIKRFQLGRRNPKLWRKNVNSRATRS